MEVASSLPRRGGQERSTERCSPGRRGESPDWSPNGNNWSREMEVERGARQERERRRGVS